MRVKRFVARSAWVVTVLVSAAACSGGSDGNGTSSAGASGAGAGGLQPPASVDLVVCASVTGDELNAATLQACGSCCNNASFDGATIYANKCVCGHGTRDDNVCKTQPEAMCPTCCTNAGFLGDSFFGDPGMSACSCFGKFDNNVCASALNAADPEPACRRCCLNNGYLGEGFTDLGSPMCSCH